MTSCNSETWGLGGAPKGSAITILALLEVAGLEPPCILAGRASLCHPGPNSGRSLCKDMQIHTPPASTLPAAKAMATRKVKMDTINQADHDQVEILGSSAFQRAWAKSIMTRLGGFPPDDAESRAEQLTTLHSLFTSGRAPHTDMAVWGPF